MAKKTKDGKIRVEIQGQYAPLLSMPNVRYKLYYGGRAGGKSYGFADALLVLARQSKLLVACVREVQNSIKDSVYRLLKDRAEYWGFEDYRFYEDRIENILTGSRFIFKGLQDNNAQNIKSLEGVDICWCFPAGTKIDGRNIEDLRPGDYVWGYNHKSNKYQYKMVTRITRRKAPDKLYNLLTSDGLFSIIGTGNHPIFVKNKGYVPLSKIKKGDVVYAEEIRPAGICPLFGWMWGNDTNRHPRKTSEICEKRRPVLQGLRKKDKFGKNEEKQSNAQDGECGENKKGFCAKESAATGFGWKWKRIYQSTKNACQKIRTGLVVGIDNTDRTPFRLADQLQGGHCEYILRDSSRSGWWKPFWSNIKARGQAKRRFLKEQRVDSVEIYEQKNLKRLRLSDGGNYVYNLEVQGTHNYFANGLLVHNCEEAQAISKKSWDILDPTIRKPGAQIWISMNRELENDPIWVALARTPDEKVFIQKVNYTDNIYCPPEMHYLAEKMKAEDYDRWLHIWGGEPVQEGDTKLIGYKEVYKALETRLNNWDMTDVPLVIGVDVARFGDDKTAIARRKGRKAYKIKTYAKMDTVQVANMVVGIIHEEHPAIVNIDVGGLGAGVVDILFDRGYREIVRAVNFGEAAQEQEKYCNRRAEMWARIKDWLTAELPVSLTDCEGLSEDLTSPNKSYDKLGRLLLEKKDDIKKRLGRSTDVGDALALTFAERYYPSVLRRYEEAEFVDDNVYTG